MKQLILSTALAGLVFCSATAGAFAEGNKVVIGEPPWPGAKMIAHLIQYVITEKLGGQAELVPGTNPIIFEAMDGGSIDVHPDVFSPSIQYLIEEYATKRGTVTLGNGSYEGSSGFCVQNFMAAEHNINSIFDLATPEAQKLFDFDGDGKGEVWIGAPGWNSTNKNEVKIRDYGIGNFLQPLKEDETFFYSKLADATKSKKGMVFYCYSPHYIFHIYDLKMLEEPAYDEAKYTMVQPNESPDWFTKSSITTGDPQLVSRVAYAKSLEKRVPEIAKFLANMDLDTDMVTEWSHSLIVEKQDPKEVIAKWATSNEKIIDRWLGL